MSTATTARRAASGLQCPKCSHLPFTTPQGLRLHNARVHDRSIVGPHEKQGRVKSHFSCSKCDRTFLKEHGLHIHEARSHNFHHTKTVKGMVDLVLNTFSSSGKANGNGNGHSLDCPSCHYDFEVLLGAKKPAAYCPGCATPIQALVDRLAAIAKNSINA